MGAARGEHSCTRIQKVKERHKTTSDPRAVRHSHIADIMAKCEYSVPGDNR